jgi:hypothetical protein
VIAVKRMLDHVQPEGRRILPPEVKLRAS